MDLYSDVAMNLALILDQIHGKLKSLDLTWDNVLYVHLYLDDMAEFGTANKAYVKSISRKDCPHGVPSRSTVESPLKDSKISGGLIVDVLATCHLPKEVLHVQSISYWAPSCIGPYSQVKLLSLNL